MKMTSKFAFSLNNIYRFGPIIIVLSFPLFISGEYFLNIGQTVCYYTMAVIGLNILIGFTGQISLGHSGFMAVGAYTTALLSTRFDLPLFVTFPISALISGLIGLLIALPAIRTKGLYLAMITVAFGLVISIIAQRWINLTGGTMGIYGVPAPKFFNQEIGTLGYFYFVAIIWAIMQWVADNLIESRWGKVLIAVMHSEEAAQTVGINISKQKIIAFVISAVYTGIAGFFAAHQTGFINSDGFSIHISVFFLVALIIGGTGSRWGPLVGATLLTVIDQVLAGLYEYRYFLYGGTLLTVLIILPEGIMGKVEKKLRRYIKNKEKNVIENDNIINDNIKTILKIDKNKSLKKQILEIKKLRRSFGGLIAVNNVNLNIQPAKVHAIIGPNGAGKSTLINLVAGLDSANEGSIIYKNTKINKLSAHRRTALGIGRTFQELQLFPELNVLDNVLLGSYRHFKSGPISYALSLPSSTTEEDELRKTAVMLLKFVGIVHLADKDINELSYGHQKLVEIARALASKPELLLLDEAVAGLNYSEINEVSNLIKKLRDIGITILLIEHNMDFVMQNSDIISVLYFGSKIAEDKPQVVQNDKKVIDAYLGGGDIVDKLYEMRQRSHLQ